MLAAPGRIRPLAVTGAALALFATLVAGCTKEEPAQALPDGATLITEAGAAMRDVESAHVRIEIEGQVSTLPLKRAEGDLLRNGDAKGTLQLSQLGNLIEYEFVVLGESIYLKGVTGGWQQLPASMAANIYDPSAILDPDRGIVKILATATEPVTEAQEKVNGVDAYRVAVKMDSLAAASLVPGMPPGVTGKLWLDTETKHLVKAVLTVPGDPPGTVNLDVSAFNAPVTVSAPV
jgi:lipoprotein LprG